jgi:uncharacterized membrane protein
MITINTKTVVLLLATLLMGLLAGVFFTWTNAITPGIGRLADVAYLQAFQHMNRTILNVPFYIVFMGSLMFSIGSAYLHKPDGKTIFGGLIAASAIHFLGVLLVTLFGNLPLNDMLDKTDLSVITIEKSAALRSNFELKWNNLHLIRTISSSTSFLLLIIVCRFASTAQNRNQ